MNTEAILCIKRAAAKCSTIRRRIIKELQNSRSPSEIQSSLNTQDNIKINITSNGINQEIDEESILNFHIIVKEGNWSERCSFSYYNGTNQNTQNLIENTKKAVIETANELCPGFPKADINNVIDMQKEEYFYTYKSEPNEKAILKAGDIIFVDALFSSENSELGKSPCAYHRESVLITGNGSEILTRKRLSVS